MTFPTDTRAVCRNCRRNVPGYLPSGMTLQIRTAIGGRYTTFGNISGAR
jgi:hypothetical protein